MEEVDSRVRQVRVFNFSVANAHNYFVGGDGVLVHNSGKNTAIYRVQGGSGSINQTSRNVIEFDDKGNVTLDPNSTFAISMGDTTHANYFLKKRPGGKIFTFDIPTWVADLIRTSAIPQRKYKKNPLNQNRCAPVLVDKKTPGESYDIPGHSWSEFIERSVIPGTGRIIKK